jgi:lysozyme
MDKARALIKKFEGCKLSAYTCPAGKLTIGFGHVMQAHEPQKISMDQAERLLDIDIAIALTKIKKLVKVSLTDNQIQALVSFVFNVGEGNFSCSTMLKKINSKDYAGASREFLRWDKARVNGKMQSLPGLTKRRLAEMELWNS